MSATRSTLHFHNYNSKAYDSETRDLVTPGVVKGACLRSHFVSLPVGDCVLSAVIGNALSGLRREVSRSIPALALGTSARLIRDQRAVLSFIAGVATTFFDKRSIWPRSMRSTLRRTSDVSAVTLRYYLHQQKKQLRVKFSLR